VTPSTEGSNEEVEDAAEEGGADRKAQVISMLVRAACTLGAAFLTTPG
jgi:hypothetical protein